MSRLEVVVGAGRPDEFGIDIILVHGITTCSIGQLDTGWQRMLTKVAPQNSCIRHFDVHLNVSDSFSWPEVQARSTELLRAICMEYEDIIVKKRQIVFVCYGLAGIVLKQTLLKLDTQSNFKRYLKAISGIVFLATPHLISRDEQVSQIFAGIVRFQTSSWAKTLFPTDDLTNLAWNALKFTELRLQCPVLSCYETKVIKISRGLPRPTRKVQLVDESCARINATNEKRVAIDVELHQIFSVHDHLIHRQIAEFLLSVFKYAERSEVVTFPAYSSPEASSAESSLAIRWKSTTSSDTSLGSTGNPGSISPKSDPRSAMCTPSEAPPSIPRSSSTQSSDVISVLTPQKSLESENAMTLQKSTGSERIGEGQAKIVFTPPRVRVPDKVHILPLEYRKPNPDFSGRKAIVEEIGEVLLPSKANLERFMPNKFVLSGPAGIGKTQIALEFCHRYIDHFDILLWASADSVDRLFALFSRFSTKLGLENQDSAKDSVVSRELIKGWLAEPFQDFSVFRGRVMTWLLIFDNADDPEILHDFWPYDGRGSVLITSRDPMTATRHYFGDIGAALGSLAKEDAADLLQKLLKQRNSFVESNEVLMQVVMKLDCYPLAIVQMAGVMARRGYSQSKFLQVYDNEARRAELLGLRAGVQHGYKSLTLAGAWNLKDMSPGAARILSVVSLFVPSSINEEILTRAPSEANLEDYPDDLDFDDRLSELTSSFIVYRKEPTESQEHAVITTHYLIQDVVRSQLLVGDVVQFVKVFNAAVKLLSSVWPHVTRPQQGYAAHNRVSRWEQCDMLLPHVKRMRQIFETLSDQNRSLCATFEFLELYSEVSWYYYEHFNPRECIDYVQATLRLYDECSEEYPSILANQYGTWAEMAVCINEPELAMTKMQRSFEIREAVHQKTLVADSHIAAAYSNTAKVMLMNGMLSQAESHIRRSMDLRRQMSNFSRLQLHNPLVYLSWIDWQRGDLTAAVAKLLEALRDREVEYGINDGKNMRGGELLYYLGRIRDCQGLFKESFDFQQRALLQLRTTLGDDDVFTAMACYQLARHTLRQRDLSLSSQLLDQSIKVFGYSQYSRPKLARAMFLRGRLLHQMHKPDQAAEAAKSATKIRRTYVELDKREASELDEADFDDGIVFWLR